MITITPDDAEAIRAFSPDAKVFVNEAAAEVATAVASSSAVNAEHIGGPPVFLFVANYRHPPNFRAASFLIREVMPLVRSRIPQAKLVLAGPHAPAELKALATDRDEFLGFVEDLTPVYQASTAVMLPVFTGTGMRIKAVEALGQGRPLIGTELGLRGLGKPSDDAFLVAETPEDFANAAVALAQDPDRRRRLGEAALEHVRENLSVERLMRDRERIWGNLVSAAGEKAAPEDDRS